VKDIALLEQLNPVHDYDLAGEVDSPEARALLARIVETPLRAARPRARRRRVAIPAFAAAAVAAAIAVFVSVGGHGTPSAAAAMLRKTADVARAQTPLVPGPGQYLYTKSVAGAINTTVPVGGADAVYNVFVPEVREIWIGPDGGRLYETTGAPHFPTARDRERWIADGSPQLEEPPSETTLPPARPLDLPSDPDALYARLEQDARGHGSGLYSEMFTLVGDSLRETSATPAQRAALFQVVARIPGVELVGAVKDDAGRAGVAVALSNHDIRSMLIFDPRTSALLAEEQVALPGNSFGYPAGSRVGYSIYLVQKIVDSDTAR